ncbi:MAG TPA: LuxR C-terminal-related transcriptional regulator [Candidatus Manganitrophaceae bacterium]|nr:LuxR C-terminal-related transcriptional regulator [Candidatus Manganitrophaceae bacterium]
MPVESAEFSFEPREKREYRRSQPGVLTFTREGEVLYMNQRGADLLDRIGMVQGFFSNRGRKLPQIILDLLVEVDRSPAAGRGGDPAEEETVSRVLFRGPAVYLFRAVRLRAGRSGSSPLLILIEEVSEELQSDRSAPPAELTGREWRVVRLLSEGKKNRAIASEMKITEYTVKEHIKRIMKRLNVTTRSGIVAQVFQQRPSGDFERSPTVTRAAAPACGIR